MRHCRVLRLPQRTLSTEMMELWSLSSCLLACVIKVYLSFWGLLSACASHSETQSSEVTQTWTEISRIMSPSSLLFFITWLPPECGYFIIVTKGTQISISLPALYLLWKVTVVCYALCSWQCCLCLTSELFHDLGNQVFALDSLLWMQGVVSVSLHEALYTGLPWLHHKCPLHPCSQSKIIPQFLIKPELTTSFPREYNMPSFNWLVWRCTEITLSIFPV